MKVLAVSASPRGGGNSDVLCDQFLKGAADAGHETEKILLWTAEATRIRKGQLPRWIKID